MRIFVTSSPTRRHACRATFPSSLPRAYLIGRRRRSAAVYGAARSSVCRVVLQISWARHTRIVADILARMSRGKCSCGIQLRAVRNKPLCKGNSQMSRLNSTQLNTVFVTCHVAYTCRWHCRYYLSHLKLVLDVWGWCLLESQWAMVQLVYHIMINRLLGVNWNKAIVFLNQVFLLALDWAVLDIRLCPWPSCLLAVVNALVRRGAVETNSVSPYS